MKLSKSVWIAVGVVLIILVAIVSLLSVRKPSGQQTNNGATVNGTGTPEQSGGAQPTKTGGLLEQIKNKISGNNSATSSVQNTLMAEEKGSLQFKGEMVTYGNEYKGYYSKPLLGSAYPGVVMVHEWWGLNDNIKGMADILASHGFNVLAVDLYNGAVATNPQEAASLVQGIDQNKSLATMHAAKEYLATNGSGKIGTLGWCFGGGQSLQLALHDPMDATVIYYGTPVITDAAQLSAIKKPLLGIFGDKDEAIPVEKINEFKAGLLSAGVDNEIQVYPGLGHAFANPSGANYAPKETQQAWKKTLAFFTTHLK